MSIAWQADSIPPQSRSISGSAQDVIASALKEAFGSADIRSVQIAEALDDLGHPALYVRLEHEREPPASDSWALHKHDVLARNIIWDRGERRFVHFEHVGPSQ
jgi:hypothetical protein